MANPERVIEAMPMVIDQDALDLELINLFDGDEIVPLDLYTACLIGDYDAVKAFIKSKVNLNRKNMYGGWTPLMYAGYVGKDTVLNLLLEEGVDVNIVSPNQGMTALMLAAKCGNESVVYFLLQHNANVDAADKQGQTSLFHAVRQDHTSVVKLLLDSGADFEKSPPRTKITPLMEAAIEGNEVAFSMLLENGTNLNAKSATGETARSLAFRYGNTMIVNIADNFKRNLADNFKRQPDSDLRSEAGLTPDDIGLGDGPEKMAGMRPPQGKNYHSDISPGYIDGFSSYPPTQMPSDYDPYSVPGFPGAQRRPLPFTRDMIPPIDATDQEPIEEIVNSNNSNNIAGDVGNLQTNNVRKNQPDDQETSVSNTQDGVTFNGEQVFPKEEARENFNHPQSQSRNRRVFPELPKSISPQLPQEQYQIPETVLEFLQKLNLNKYATCFDENNIDLTTLLTFEDDDLRRIGIKKLGPRKNLVREIHMLRGKLNKASPPKVNQTKEVPGVADRGGSELQQAMIIEHLRNELHREQQSRREMQTYFLTERKRTEHVLHTLKELHKNCSEASSQLTHVRAIHSDIMGRLTEYKDEGKLEELAEVKDNDKHILDLHKTMEGQLVTLNNRMSMTARYTEQTLMHMISTDNPPTGNESYS